MYATISADEVLSQLNATSNGLFNADINNRRLEYGYNELPQKKRSLVKLFLSQFNDIMVFILFGALIVSIISAVLESETLHLEAFVEPLVIAAILILNALLGFFQEYKAEEAIAMLKKLTSPHSRVRRNGHEMDIPSRELVPGDIVILEAGSRISADGRLLSVSHFRVNESSLTGESLPVDKQVDPVVGQDVATADQRSMVFAGTLVTRGYAEYVVTEIGINTQIGRIAQLVSDTDFPETPLQKRMKWLGKMLGAVVLGLCVLVFGLGIIEDRPLIEMLLIAVSLAVSAVPEGLPAVVTVCMAMGVRRMAKRNALVRRLESLETLGSVTVICTDKTGTITENRMSVVEYWGNDSRVTDKDIALIMASCNRAQLPDLGDPTEIGLLEFAERVGAERLEITEEQVPFSSENKYMQTKHGKRVFIKGAPERLFDMADDESVEILHKNDEFAARGLRVLACAEKIGNKIHCIGLVAMEDPARPTVKASIALAAAAGIRTIMITGDNIKTAAAIAEQVGIKGKAMQGIQLDGMDLEELREHLEDTSIFARVSPEHKLKILEALQANHEIVAMSGDGVNDAPALKGAHVGVAMGKVGTEVAREAASVVLTDDNYSTIVAAVEEGRRIYDNIRKFVLYLVRTNFYQLLFITGAMLLNLPLPYLPIHILWINLVTDGFPALALGVEKAEPDLMKRPPRASSEHILSGETSRLISAAIIGCALNMVFFLYLLNTSLPLENVRSTMFILAVLFELVAVFSIRTFKPIWRSEPWSNKWLLLSVAGSFALIVLILVTPAAAWFQLTTVAPVHWLYMIAVCAVGLILFEITKLVSTSKPRLSL